MRTLDELITAMNRLLLIAPEDVGGWHGLRSRKTPYGDVDLPIQNETFR